METPWENLEKPNNIPIYFLILQVKFRGKLFRTCHHHSSQFWPYNIGHHGRWQAMLSLTWGSEAISQIQYMPHYFRIVDIRDFGN